MIKLTKGREKGESSSPNSESVPANSQPDPIETCRKNLQEHVKNFERSPSDKKAEKLIRLGSELARQYENKLLLEGAHPNGRQTNSEQDLWKGCFYSLIEALKKHSASGGPHANVYAEYLSQLINEGIKFYGNLLRRYEETFHLNFASHSRWPSSEDGYPNAELDESCISNMDETTHDTALLRSAQRLLISLGDLHRYKEQQLASVECRDYSAAQKYYLQAHCLEAMVGHPLNQLGTIAYYRRHWVECVFFYVRALSVQIPFESARDTLEVFLNKQRGPALHFEQRILERIEEGKKNEERQKGQRSREPDVAKAADGGTGAGSKYIRETWIRPNSDRAGEEAKNGPEAESPFVHLFTGDHAIANQKQAIVHLLSTAGILISDIDIERLKQSSALVFDEFGAFLGADQSLLSPLGLLQVVYIYAFPLFKAKPGTSQTLIDERRKGALRIVTGILEQLLRVICKDLDKIGLFLLTGGLSKKFSRALPSLCFVLEVLCASPNVRLDLLHIPASHIVWTLLASLCNILAKLRATGELANCAIEGRALDAKKTHSVVILPEFVVTSPFFKAIPKRPLKMFVDYGETDTNGNILQTLAVHARFGLVLDAGQRLAADKQFPLFALDVQQNLFKAIQPAEDVDSISERIATQQLVQQTDSGGAAAAECELLGESGKENSASTAADESELKKRLLSDEENSFEHRWILEIRPKYLVPDTNTFIDHLDSIQLLVHCGLFTVLVPTIVIDEIEQLTLGVVVGSTLLSRELLNPEGSRSAYVMQQAKAAREWLRASADQRLAHIGTVTSNGNILNRLSFAMEAEEQGKKRSNDDRILSVCISLSNNLSRAGSTCCSTSADSTRLERVVVLLTEDRGLSAKANAEKIPVRTIPSFAKWALGREAVKKAEK